MKYSLVNLGMNEGWICMSFENKKELNSFCSSYHYQPITARESKKHDEIKNVRSFGIGNDRYWRW